MVHLSTPITAYHSPNFRLDILPGDTSTSFHFQLHNSRHTTSYYPQTFALLKHHLPSVLNTECFNKQNLPFAEKVKDTMIAHLFEHLLLENLYLEKHSRGFSSVCYNGWTTWNWHKEPAGFFRITVNTGLRENHIFQTALQNSLQLIELILNSPVITATA